MVRVYYKAIAPNGQFKRGYIDNSTASTVHQTLVDRHYVVLSCAASSWFAFRRWKKQISLLELAEICFHLAAFDEAGLSLVEGLIQVQRLCPKKAIVSALGGIIDDVKQGKSLSQAFQKQSFLNHRILVSLLQVGEKVGCFYPYLRQAEQSFRWEHDLKQSVRQTLIYPCILLAFLCVLIFITVVILVPNLQAHLKIVGGTLSSPLTASLIGISNFFHHHIFEIVGVFMAVISGVLVLKRVSKTFDLWVSGRVYSIPYVGGVKAQLVYLSFFQQLSVMLSNDLELLSSLQQATGGCSNKWLQKIFYTLQDLFLKGHSFSQALKKLPHLPPFILKYAELGEKTGNLAIILEKACQHELVRLKKQLIRLTSWIQPTLIIIMGLILIWIILAILVPLYDSLSHIDF